MKKNILMIMVLGLFAPSLFAEDIDNKFENANLLYKASNYEESLEKYLEIKNKNIISSELYYNLGNTYFRLNDYPNCILYYERALRLEPNNNNINNNLKVVKSRLKGDTYVLSEFFLFSFWKDVANLFMPKIWIIINVLLFLLTCVSFIFYYYTIDKKVLSFYIFLGLSFLFINSFSLGITRQRLLNDRSYAIVFFDNVQGKDSPDSKLNSKYSFYKGQKLKIIDEMDSWYKIRIEDGKEMWGEKCNFVII